MKKIKYVLFAILIMVFMPKVYAAEGVAIESVTVDSKSDSAVIVSPATFDGLSLKFDLKFNDINDYIKYKIVIKNTTSTDFELTESSSSSEYITYEYGYEDGNKVLTGNSSKTMFITVKYSSAVPASSFSEGKYTETKSITINLEDGTDEVTNPSTLDGLYCYLVLLVGTLVFSIALLKATHNKKYLVLVLASMVLIPMNINAIVKLKLTVESKVEINNSTETVKNIYWALQENGTTQTYSGGSLITVPTYKLVISDSEVDGDYKGSIAENTIFGVDEVSGEINVPWILDDYSQQFVTDVKIEGHVAPVSTAFWFVRVGSLVDELSIDIENLDTSNVTNMDRMFCGFGDNVDNLSLDLSGFDTSNVTSMSGMFEDIGFSSNTFSLNLSGWDTSKVENMTDMFLNAGFHAKDTSRSIVLPDTNGNGISNTSTRIYGINELVFADTNNYKVFV